LARSLDEATGRFGDQNSPAASHGCDGNCPLQLRARPQHRVEAGGQGCGYDSIISKGSTLLLGRRMQPEECGAS
jgi:hypothetical protein